MHGPVVSIIMPTYGHEHYIAEAIRSVQAQTYPDWELIVMDDGSPDGTLAAARQFAAFDPRITCLTQAHKGIFALGESYNLALSHARGRYVAILEGDDVWVPEKLEWQVAAMEQRPEAVLAWGRALVSDAPMDGPGLVHPLASRDTATFANDPPGKILNTLYFGNHIPALTILLRKSALDAVGGFRQSHGLPLVDLPTILPMAERGPFLFDGRTLGGWRIYAGQVTKTHTVAMIRGQLELTLEHFDQLQPQVAAQVNVKRTDIMRRGMDMLLIAYARSGRYRLIRKEYTAARKDQLKAIFFPSTRQWMWRLRALVGLIAGTFHTDVEGLAHFLGKKRYTVQ